MARVILAMSGGVDSSVAARLLLDAGQEVIGVFMRHGVESPAACDRSLPIVSAPVASAGVQRGCCTAADAADARRVADCLDIPFYALDLQQEFGRVMDYFVDEYSSGRTPNPCVVCNHWIKFGRLFDYADSVGAEFVATGHYARLQQESPSRWSLLRGIDSRKDQSYVLFGIHPALLPRMQLPVGKYRKTEIRQIAASLGLRVAEKKDSQEICFVTEGHHSEFVARRRSRDTHGEFVDTSGRFLGYHDGIERFTVGQRKGLGIALGTPHFVVRIEPDTCRVVLGRRQDLARTQLTAAPRELACFRPPGNFLRTRSDPIQQPSRRGERHSANGRLLRGPLRRALFWGGSRSGGGMLRRGSRPGWRLDRMSDRLAADPDRPAGS